jgi:ABC-2 type transport system permease protein
MTPTILRINWLNLKRDRIALGLTFVLPIIFFSIFAWIFGGVSKAGPGSRPDSLKVAVVDEDGSDISRRFINAIDDQEALAVFDSPPPPEEDRPPGESQPAFNAQAARQAVREGDYPAAIIIPKGFSERFGNYQGDRARVELIYDEANPIAQNTVAGLIQAAAFTAAPDVLMEKGFGQFDEFGGSLTRKQRELIDEIRPYLRGDKAWEELEEKRKKDSKEPQSPSTAPAPPGAPPEPRAGFGGMIDVTASPARQTAKSSDIDSSNIIAYYAASIGVMFLLFSMAGAGGFLLEQEEMGVLERLLTANVGMTRLLLGSWLFFSLVGMAQMSLMFVFAAFAFHLDLFTTNHLAGCAVMVAMTSLAAAAFAMILATASRSRAQLGGMSTIIILIMSALGGSMVPRFVAPAVFNKTSPFTFNGWALDGFLKVFWYDDPAAGVMQSVAALWPQVLAMVVMTVAFLTIARLLARRWKAA